MHRLLILRLGLLVALYSNCYAQSASNLIQLAAKDLAQGSAEIIDPGARDRLLKQNDSLVQQLQKLGAIEEIVGAVDEVDGPIWRATGRALHACGLSDWELVYSGETAKIVRAQLRVTPIGQPIPAPFDGAYRGLVQRTAAQTPAALTPCALHPSLCQTGLAPAPDPRLVEFLFATTRGATSTLGRTSFSGERANGVSYGATRVRVPDDHVAGRIELPSSIKFVGFEIYEQKANPKKHFVIKEVRQLSEQVWDEALRAGGSDEALVFVHGYNTSFDAALYRTAQIIWDLKYRGKAVLFTWASRGNKLDYVYDQQSALIASARFGELIKKLGADYGIKRVHVLAHSMGNYLVLDTLRQRPAADPLKIAELILAAPDIDRDLYIQYALPARRQAGGMTMYASSADKALVASRHLAGDIPRAGDVPSSGPTIFPGVETIDVTALGDEILGLNHDTFAARRDVMNDIHLLLSMSPRRRPSERLAASVIGMPVGAETPVYWRFQP